MAFDGQDPKYQSTYDKIGAKVQVSYDAKADFISQNTIVQENKLSKMVTINGIDINKLDNVKYCQIVGYNVSLFGKKIVITVDYGQKMKFGQPQQIAGQDGDYKTFNSMIHALNFMEENGWQYVNSYSITLSNSQVYHYLLKRKK